MEHNTDQFLKDKLAIDEMDLEAPDLSLVNEAREKIKLRGTRRPEATGFFDELRARFGFIFNPVPAGIAALLLIGSIFYFANTETQKSELALNPQNATQNYSISTSTVLASLTQYTNNKTATASSTVLTSIITLVVRN